jgi:hypothetical protein
MSETYFVNSLKGHLGGNQGDLFINFASHWHNE